MWRTSCFLLLSVIVLTEGQGFTADRCDDMDPTRLPPQNYTVEEEDEETGPLRLSQSLNLYRLVTTSPRYRRGKTMDISIRGPAFNAFMLQMRDSDGRRAGRFVSWPRPQVRSVTCADSTDALTNTDFSPKSGVTVRWKAPDQDAGDLHVVARFVAGNEYWQLTEGREIPMSEFPADLSECGKSRSCVLQGGKSCGEDDCNYVLAFDADASDVRFTMAAAPAAATEHSYVAIGFAPTIQAETMSIVACSRSKTVAEIKSFAYTLEEGLVESSVPRLQDNKMEVEDGGRLWCSFKASLRDVGVPSHQVYMRGATNQTSGSNFPIIPENPLVSKSPIALDKIRLQRLTSEHKAKKTDNKSAATALLSQPQLLAALAFAVTLLCF